MQAVLIRLNAELKTHLNNKDFYERDRDLFLLFVADNKHFNEISLKNNNLFKHNKNILGSICPICV